MFTRQVHLSVGIIPILLFAVGHCGMLFVLNYYTQHLLLNFQGLLLLWFVCVDVSKGSGATWNLVWRSQTHR